MQKSLLFIGVNYFSYTPALVSEFERQGYAVTYYDIDNWNWRTRSVNALSQGKFKSLRDEWHRSIARNEAGKQYDVVFFLQSHQINEQNMRELRATQRSAKFILYTWDSVITLAKLHRDYRENLPYFDKAYTFDCHDAETLNINYLPLFCIRQFQRRTPKYSTKKSVYFVGNMENVKRYLAVNAFRDYCEKNGITFNSYLACRPRMYLRLLQSGLAPRGLSMGRIPQERFESLMDCATAVFDFANHQQSGLTMRALENLCAEKKIITNNKNIKRGAFYSPDRIHVYQDLDFTGVSEFLEGGMEAPRENFDRYYIQNFVTNVLQ